ncbi:hypothetical protein FIBSPDRAFT_936296 [Athelia psychrophila]|uniref:Uncharacterized protein n=1 Tax=Athelia psychrophila TaxID=1759441 RepID=A0A166CEB2_9AGAM|nr:hypothetical protein FIBSPDRAFT_936296 [Fibularhizoctonia sp. CBS 109695]
MCYLLQDGQFYYFINTIFASLAGVVSVSPVSPIYQSAFTWPAFAIEAIMTCKVFRAMILRSLHPARNGNVSFGAAKAHTTAMSIIELDTFLDLRIRTMSTEREQIW